MGNFENKIPDYVRLLKKENKDLEYEDRRLEHECDCRFCDQQDEIPDDDWPRHLEIEKEIRQNVDVIEALTRHAKLHGIVIEEKVAK